MKAKLLSVICCCCGVGGGGWEWGGGGWDCVRGGCTRRSCAWPSAREGTMHEDKGTFYGILQYSAKHCHKYVNPRGSEFHLVSQPNFRASIKKKPTYKLVISKSRIYETNKPRFEWIDCHVSRLLIFLYPPFHQLSSPPFHWVFEQFAGGQ